MKKKKRKNGFWNHRVMAHIYEGEVYFKIHEVHYKKKNIPYLYSKNTETIEGDSVKSLKWTLKKMKDCLKKPILYYGERFPEEYLE